MEKPQKIKNQVNKNQTNASQANASQANEKQANERQANESQTKKGQNLVARKGRGSASNAASRYLARQNEYDEAYVADQAQQAVKTELFVDQTRKLITTNRSPDIPFDQSINPYKGCEHGCIYCFARPTHAYLDLSPGLDFETKIFRKSNPREHLLVELSRRNYTCSPIAMGTNTDPYQPLERSQGVTREILETLLECHHPVTIVTKSKLILRDLDLLRELAARQLVHVSVSVTSLSNSLKGLLEPRTAGPAARLRTIAELRNAGVPTGAMIAPVIPFINDDEIEKLVLAVRDAGALTARYILLRLPLEVKPLFEEWLQVHFPDRANRVMSAVRDTRGGRAYRSQWHTRMVGQGPVAELIANRFKVALSKAGLKGTNLPTLRTDLFQPPQHQAAMIKQAQKDARQQKDTPQLTLF